MPLKILLDLDPGIDDALALAFALAHPRLELQAVTTTFGCVPVAQATRNALLVCALAGRPELPVCPGVATPLRKAVMHHDPARHGHDGLGDLSERPADIHGPDERTAARCIVQQAQAHPGELCIVTGGPLGNLVQAMRLEPRLPELLQAVVVTGGSIAAPGNVSPVAEFNFWQDPHAADTVLTAGFPLTLLGLDVSETTPVPLALAEELAQRRPHPVWTVLQHALRHAARYRLDLEPAAPPACTSPALLGLLHLIEPSMFRTESGRVRVVPEGLAEGQSIMDRGLNGSYPQPGWEDSWPRLQAAVTLDTTAALAQIRTTLERAWPTPEET